jgi:hypothetical protein
MTKLYILAGKPVGINPLLKKAFESLCEVSIICVRFLTKMIYVILVEIPNAMPSKIEETLTKIHPVGAELFHVDRPTERRRTDRETEVRKLMSSFCNFGEAVYNSVKLLTS